MVRDQPVQHRLKIFSHELSNELSNILNYWMQNTVDKTCGGFLGRIDNENNIIPDSPKGSVLNSRILYSFSSAYNFTKNSNYLQTATMAYHYINDYFIDKEHGGVYWLVDYKGKPLDTKKQVYAVAFTIYGLSEYYLASGDEQAKTTAITLFHTLVEKSYDPIHTGYLEAFARDWQPVSVLRLSAKDVNEKKTMNTHLHVLEAYTTLYKIWPDEQLKDQIVTLIRNFLDHFININTYHINLFFDEKWNSRSGLVSYGHDIEATWLLQEAAEAIKDAELLAKVKGINIHIANATIGGLDADGGLYYEYEPFNDHLIKEKHWWVQAEAMVGFYNTWQISGDIKYLDLAEKCWEFVKHKILDKTNGEWFWGINQYGEVMPGEDKAGIWKCPYHNSRACIEIIKRIENYSGKII
jgi:mannobiose 2-epimerase